ncbi:type II secretion system minor pseudopilin GspI [Parasphingorhabdus sp.]|uniref:type II secretion system minor pseudopilin GspI n=1 Tax=Parasphingorhabdus sp. TaxID=2709688 RepID=UPI003C70D57D
MMKPGAKSDQRGFTLIEMLVALSVFSLAALALIRLQAFTTHNAAELELRVVAQSVVRNRAVEILTDPRPPSLGDSSGEEQNGGLGWTWTQSAQLTEEGRFIQVDITAREKISGAPASLTILRPAGMLIEAEAPLQAN